VQSSRILNTVPLRYMSGKRAFENNMQDSFGGLVSVYLGHGSPNYDCGQVN